jgi:hypothetical protein
MLRSGCSGSSPTQSPLQPPQTIVSLHSLVQYAPPTVTQSPACSFVVVAPRKSLGAAQAACAGDRPKAATSTAPRTSHRVSERATTGECVRRGQAGTAKRLHLIEEARELPLGLPQHPDEHRPERPVLLAVDQELGEDAALGIGPELADPLGAVEVWQHQDVEKFGASGRRQGFEASSEPAPHLVEGHGGEARASQRLGSRAAVQRVAEARAVSGAPGVCADRYGTFRT